MARSEVWRVGSHPTVAAANVSQREQASMPAAVKDESLED